MEECKELLLQNGEVFLAKCKESRGKIARLACSWVRNGAVSLIYYYFISQSANKIFYRDNFTLILWRSQPKNIGRKFFF
jgi:hypothetical protein